MSNGDSYVTVDQCDRRMKDLKGDVHDDHDGLVDWMKRIEAKLDACPGIVPTAAKTTFQTIKENRQDIITVLLVVAIFGKESLQLAGVI